MTSPWLETQLEKQSAHCRSLPLLFDSKLRQAALVRGQIFARERQGEQVLLPPPCCDIYGALSPRYRPNTKVLVHRMKEANRSNYVDSMANMLLTETPAPCERNERGTFLPPPNPPVKVPAFSSGSFYVHLDDTVTALSLKAWKNSILTVKGANLASLKKEVSAPRKQSKKSAFWQYLQLQMEKQTLEKASSDNEECSTESQVQSGPTTVDPRWMAAAVLLFPKLETLTTATLPVVGNSLRIASKWLTLRSLNLSQNTFLQTKDLEALSLETLETINVSRCPRLRSLHPLAQLHRLREIDASNCELLGVQEEYTQYKTIRLAKSDPVKDWLQSTARHAEEALESHSQGSTALLQSKSVEKLAVRGCHGVRHLDVSCSVEVLDLSHLDQLKSISGLFRRLHTITIAHCPQMESLEGNMLADVLPSLNTLIVQHCSGLNEVDLHTIRGLKRIRLTHCTKLSRIKSLPRCLAYLDLTGSEKIDDRRVLKLLDVREESLGYAEETNLDILIGQTSKVLLKTVGTCNEGTRCSVVDFWSDPESKEFHYKLLPQTDSTTFVVSASEENEVYETMTLEGYTQHKVLVILPTDDRCRKYLLKDFRLQAAHSKFRIAQLEAVAHMKGIGPQLTDAREELEDALDFAIREPIRDVSLLRSILPLSQNVDETLGCILPNKEIVCWLGCGAAMRINEYVEHEWECEFRRELCSLHEPHGIIVPESGGTKVSYCRCGVQVRNMEHHKEVETELEAACKTWDNERLSKALTNACDPSHPLHESKECKCESCILSQDIIQTTTALLELLETARRDVAEVMEHQNIAIDFVERDLRLLKEITFEEPPPPEENAGEDAEGEETPAEKPPAEAEESPSAPTFVVSETALPIVDDLAAILKSFMARMVIEGHTADDTDGPLAESRATLVCSLLMERGVPESILIPKGCAGGGDKIVIYLQEKEEKEDET